MNDKLAELHFSPKSPVNYGIQKLLKEEQFKSKRWINVTVTACVYFDLNDNAMVSLGFEPDDSKGNVDRTRGYSAVIGNAEKVKDPIVMLGNLADIAQHVEDTFASKLELFFGEPGQPLPEKFDAR